MLEEPARKRWSRAPRGASAGPRRRRWPPKAWRWPSTTSMLRRGWPAPRRCARAAPGAGAGPAVGATPEAAGRGGQRVGVREGEREVGQAARKQLGGLHIRVNNAGAGGQYLGCSVQEMPIEDWDIIVQTHLRSSFLCSKFALPALRASGFGRIVNTSSMNVTGGGRPGVGN